MDTKIWDPKGEHIFDDKVHIYDYPEPGFTKTPKLPPELEERESIIRTILNWSILPFIIILMIAGFVTLHLFNKHPTKLTAFLSTYIFFWLIATFIFSMIIKNFLELWVDYRRYDYLDKNSTRVLAISFVFSSIGLLAEMFFFFEYHLYKFGYVYLGLITVLVWIITYYSIITIFYSSSSLRIVVLGIVLSIVLVLLAISSRYILINLLDHVKTFNLVNSIQ